MPIAAKRFNFLDNETNLAISDFTDPTTSDIFNSPNLELKDMDADMSEFLQQGVANGDLQLTPTTDSLKDNLRKAKDAYSSLKDLRNLNQRQVDDLIAKSFPNNPAAAAAFKQLAPSCRTGPMSRYNSGRPFDSNVNCNGRTRSSPGGCTNGIGSILNKLTNGQYNSEYNNLNQSMSNLVALSTAGYNGNMCGVFGALSSNLDPKVVARGAGMLLGSLGSSKNLLGVLDLSSAIGGPGAAVQGANVMKELPGGISGVFDNFAIPDGVTERGFGQLHEGVDHAMGNFDSSWNQSSLDGIPSCSFIKTPSYDYAYMLRGSTMDYSVDEDDLDAIPDNPTNSIRAGLTSKFSDIGSPNFNDIGNSNFNDIGIPSFNDTGNPLFKDVGSSTSFDNLSSAFDGIG